MVIDYKTETGKVLTQILENDPFGMKIPDLIVSRLVGELHQIAVYRLQEITVLLILQPSLFAKVAYELWRSNSLTLVHLFSQNQLQQVQRTASSFIK